VDKLEKVKKGLHCHVRKGNCTDCPYTDAFLDYSCTNILMNDALDLLEEKARVIHFDELKEYVNLPVWFEEKEGDLYCVLIDTVDEFDTRVINNEKKYRSYFLDWLNDYYFVDWRCWIFKPTDEQRKALGWKDGEQE